MITSINAGKLLGKIQHLIKTDTPDLKKKTVYRLEIEGNFLDLINSIYKPPTANIILSG